MSGCSTGNPQPISASALAEAQTFPYFKVYWVGHTFLGYHLGATDGLRSYISSTRREPLLRRLRAERRASSATGTCKLPFQVTTVIYHLHSNEPLGPQQNVLLEACPR